ncbi:unnamed protein product [Closterium sp. NIES-65]|nr:unnamed protein product [Closterium sp. NIES-65]
MEWLTSAESLNARQELEASVREHHPHLRDEEVDLIVDGRLLRMVRERAAEQAPASSQQGGTGEGGAMHEAPSAVGIGGGALAPTIDTGIIGTSYGQFKFGVEHISTQLDQLRKGDDETAESYCNRARTIRAELLTIGQEVHMATFAAHVLKGLPPDDESAFSGAVNTIVATTGVNEKEGKGGREQTDKKKDGKREKKRAPFKGRCYNCNEEGHMAAKCPSKKKDTTPAAAANVAEGDGKGVALTVACSAAKLLAKDKDLWFLDSGCSQHMTGLKEWFTVIRDPSATKSVKEFDGSMQEVAGMKANLVSPGQLLDKGTKLQTEEGVTRFIASGGQVAATARYRHRLHCLDLKPGPTRNGATAAAVCNGMAAAAACNGTAAAAACTNMAGGAASNSTEAAATCNGMAAAAACNGRAAAASCNGRAAAAWTATNSGMLGMDLEKGGEDTSSASSQEAKLTRQTLPLPDEREGEVLGMVYGPEQNQPPSHTVIIISVSSVQGGEQPFDRSVDPTGSNATMAPPALCPSLAACLAPVGPEVGPSADERRAADEDKEGEATDLKSATTHGKDPIPTIPPLQPTSPPPCHSSRSNKGMPPVRLPASTMTASDVVDGNNMYGIAFLARGAYGTDIYYDVEYLDEADEEEGGLRSIIIKLEVTLTGPEGKVVDKGLLVVEYMSSTEGYLGLQIVRDHPNKTLLLHQNAYAAKVQQRFFKGAPLKKQPITPLSSASFAKQDAGQFANRQIQDSFC